ncbi:hypothetical protein BKA69DRAFT_198548 [Paraphysoderma sedebokerense]|nr:hypothetical protein BKA69DRAFT_198548 [Paraphysoderma sedebokerense]
MQILTYLTRQFVANIDNAKLLSKLMLLNQSLEKKVFERTLELQQRNEELERAKAEAIEAASTKAMFLSNMSHEIRTPISQLLSTVDLPPDGLEYLNIIIHSGKLLLSLVNDVLDLSKLETGNVTLEFIEFDLYELIQISMDAFTVENDVKVGYYMEKDVPRIVIGDVTRLRQIITNLVSNAIKFTRSGYVFLCVCCDQVNENEFDVEFNVIDSGCGISPQFMSKIFDRYAQEDASITRKFGGTGLGLPICQDLCKLMGSKITIKSEVNHGSTFSFTIRFTRPDSPPQPSQFYHALDNTLKIVILQDPVHVYKSKTILCYQIETMGADRNCFPMSQRHGIDFELYELLIIDMTTMQDPGIDLIDIIQRCHIPVILIYSASQIELADQIYHKINSEIHPTAIYKLLHPYKQSSLFKLVSSLVKTHDLPSSSDEPVDVPSGDSTIISQDFEEGVKEFKDRSDRPESEPERISILLVEDNEINQKIMRMMLMKLGFSADIACDGQVAVEMAESKHYDLILMDVRIPVLNGLEATRQIREHCRDSEIAFGSEAPVSNPYIVGLSANVSPEHEIEGLRAGMDLYLSKPISRSTLSEVFSHVQEGQAQRSDIAL